MTKDETAELKVLSSKIETLITSHKELKDDVKGMQKCQTKDETAIAVLIEQYGTMKSRVESWNIINSVGVGIVAIAAGFIGIFKK